MTASGRSLHPAPALTEERLDQESCHVMINDDELRSALRTAGLKDSEFSLAVLIPLAQMAIADGHASANERVLLDAACEEVVLRINAKAGFQRIKLARALLTIERFLEVRLTKRQRKALLAALPASLEQYGEPRGVRASLVGWARAIAAVDGSPVWHPREHRLLKELEEAFAQPDVLGREVWS